MEIVLTKKEQKQKERAERLVPNGVPRYIRCYDMGEGQFDRYTVCYTGNYKGKAKGWHDYVGMSANPFHPQGFGQHGQTEFQPCDKPSYKHLGKKIKFEDLPKDCQKLVMDDYLYLWDFTDEYGNPL